MDYNSPVYNYRSLPLRQSINPMVGISPPSPPPPIGGSRGLISDILGYAGPAMSLYSMTGRYFKSPYLHTTSIPGGGDFDSTAAPMMPPSVMGYGSPSEPSGVTGLADLGMLPGGGSTSGPQSVGGK